MRSQVLREGQGSGVPGGGKHRLWSLIDSSDDRRNDGLVTLLPSPALPKIRSPSREPVRKANSQAGPTPQKLRGVRGGGSVCAFTGDAPLVGEALRALEGVPCGWSGSGVGGGCKFHFGSAESEMPGGRFQGKMSRTQFVLKARVQERSGLQLKG